MDQQEVVDVSEWAGLHGTQKMDQSDKADSVASDEQSHVAFGSDGFPQASVFDCCTEIGHDRDGESSDVAELLGCGSFHRRGRKCFCF